MPVVMDGHRVTLSGRCTIGDAEPLRAFLLAHEDGLVDLGPCEQAHLAVLQLIRIAGASVVRWPDDPVLATQIARIVEEAS